MGRVPTTVIGVRPGVTGVPGLYAAVIAAGRRKPAVRGPSISSLRPQRPVPLYTGVPTTVHREEPTLPRR